ncbi:pyridoxamine 5'-phosphate oxidase family protein [Kocuria sp. U4B]
MTHRKDGADDGTAKVRAIIKNTRIALLTHVDPEGRLVAKPMATQDVDFDGTVYFIAERDSDQVQHLQQRPAVNVAYAGDGAWVSLAGAARVVDDVAKLRELWDTFTGAWLEGGPENPNNVLIEVTPDTAEYWDQPGGHKLTQVANLLKASVTGRRLKGDNEVVDL